MQLHHTSYFIYLNLNPCDALFGGRTSPAKLFHESLTEKACYNDFTSLYPFVQKKISLSNKTPRDYSWCSEMFKI
jgi:hypothetical protein